MIGALACVSSIDPDENTMSDQVLNCLSLIQVIDTLTDSKSKMDLKNIRSYNVGTH